MARSTDGGTTWTAPTALNTNAATDTGDDLHPQVTTDEMGRWIAVWDSNDSLGNTLGSDYDILFARSIGATAATPTPTVTATPTLTSSATPTSTPIPTVSPTPLCGLMPDVGCRKPTAPLRSTIDLKDRLPDTHDGLTWKWTKGEGTLKADFGDPLATTSYALCVYDRAAGTPTLKVAADIPAGGTCAGKPCWKEKTHGFKYVDKEATPEGVVSLVLKEGLEGRTQITLKAKGINLEMPSLPLDQDPAITVQLKNDRGICWDADYTVPAIRNEQVEFRDKSD
jgi:hypothetical protein